MSSIPTVEAVSPTTYTSTWHSPVPYLFGGLAAMLGLIAFALLILACSYWKLSGQINDAERDLEAGEGYDNEKVVLPVLEEKYIVIMAGQVRPTFLAAPTSSRASSFASKGCTCGISSSTRSSGSSTLSVEEGNAEKGETNNNNNNNNNNGQVEMGNLEAQQDLRSHVH